MFVAIVVAFHWLIRGFRRVLSPVMNADSIAEIAGSAEAWPGKCCIAIVEMRQAPEEHL